MTYKIRMDCEYEKKNPLRDVKVKFTNLSGVDIFFCDHGSPYDFVRTGWTITNDSGTARYNGVKCKRMGASRDPDAWTEIKKGGTLSQVINLEYRLPDSGSNEYDVKYDRNEIAVLTEKNFVGGELQSQRHVASIEKHYKPK